MYKKILRIIAITLVVSVALSLTAYAVETRESRYIFKTTAQIFRDGGGAMTVEFSVTDTKPMTMIGAEEVRIYGSDGTVVRFYYTDKGCEEFMSDYTTGYYSNRVSYQGKTGVTYYAVVTLYCGDATGNDTRNHTTDDIVA